jgi:hypothetical protein
MAIIISYPSARTVTVSDILLGTQFDQESGANITKNFSVGKIVDLTIATLAQDGVSGSFETVDLKLVTVTNGIITSIEAIG